MMTPEMGLPCRPDVDVQRTWRKFGWKPHAEWLAANAFAHLCVTIKSAQESARKVTK